MAYKICRRRVNADCSAKAADKDPVAQFRLEKLRRFEAAREEGNDVEASLRIVGVPNSTLCRWQGYYKNFGTAGLVSRH